MNPLTSSDRSRPLLLALLVSLASWLVCLGLATARLRGLLINSMLLAGGALLVSLPLGVFLSLALTKTTVWGRRVLQAALVVLLFVPLYVQAAAWQATIGPTGWLLSGDWLAGWRGAIWVHGMAAVPWVVLFTSTALRRVPRELEEEALQVASAWQVLIGVSLRRAVAAVSAAALWIAVICMSEITITDLFQVRTFAEEIYTAANLGTLESLAPSAIAGNNTLGDVPWLAARELMLGTLCVALLVAAACAAVALWVPLTDFVSLSSSWVWRLQYQRWGVSIIVWCVAAVVLAAPLLGLVGKAGEQYTNTPDGVVQSWSVAKATSLVAASPWQHRREFGWTGAIGLTATMMTVVISVLLAWALRTRRLPVGPTAWLLSFVFAIPGPLLGVWIISALNHPAESIFAPLTWCYDHTILAPVLAQSLRALPLATLVLAVQFASLPQDVLDSARSEGAGWWRQLYLVALPWCWPAVVATACLAMIVAVGDLAATLLVVPPGVSPLSVRIFGLLHYGAEDQVAAVCLTLIALVVLVAMVSWWLIQKVNRQP